MRWRSKGSIAAGTQTDITRSAVGLCVRAGAQKPDIATVAALKRTLLAARSIAYSDGPSGLYIAGLLERLGIAAEMKPKAKLTTGPVAELVAKGEAEIGLQQIVAILPIKGAELVGPLPSELQNVIVYAAGLSARAAQQRGGARFRCLHGDTRGHAHHPRQGHGAGLIECLRDGADVLVHRAF